MPRRLLLPALAGLIALSASGCATNDYVARTAPVRELYGMGKFSRAAAQLDQEEPDSSDRLLYLLDKGMILHSAKLWKESNAALAEAEKLAPRLDYTSISQEAAALATSDNAKTYVCEDYELLLLNILKAINYAMLEDDEAALVEVRRANDRLKKMVNDEKKPYEQLAIATYLSGVLYERARDPDDAIIAYMAAAKQMGSLGPLAGPFLRAARAAGRTELFDTVSPQYPDVDPSPLGGDGEVVVILERGLSPQKVDVQHATSLIKVPTYRSRSKAGVKMTLRTGQGDTRAVAVTSIEDTAQRMLQSRLTGMAVKSAVSSGVKVAAGAAVAHATGSKELGYLTTILMLAGNRPDLRSWLSLPAEFQVARLRLPPGRQTIEVPTSWGTKTLEVDVKAGKIGIVALRVL